MFTDQRFKNNVPQLILTAFFSLLFLTLFHPAKAHAAYSSNKLIDDAVLLDARSLDAGQIQDFLNNRGGQISSKQFIFDCDAAGQQSKQLYLSLGAPCGQSATAASIIYYVAQVYGISPKVIMATMQKEQSLITATDPTGTQYAQAMGYSCPTSGSCNDSSNFFWQVDNGTWALRFHYERARGNNNWWYVTTSWVCGSAKDLYKPSLYPGQDVQFFDGDNVNYTTIHILNAATSAFYCYTPHVFNNFPGCKPAYGVSYADWKPTIGDKGMCYSGSYNFVTYFETWWGTTTGNRWLPLQDARIMVTNKDTSKVNPDTGQSGQAIPSNLQVKFSTKTSLYDATGCLRTKHDTDYNVDSCIKITDLSEFTPTVSNLNTSGAISSRSSLQKTCKVDYLREEVTNQCFDASTVIAFQKKVTALGVDYIITKHDADLGATTGFRLDRFSQSPVWSPLLAPRILETNKATYKINPYTGEQIQSVSSGQEMEFQSKMDDCIRTKHDSENNLDFCIKIADLSEFTPVVTDLNAGGAVSTKTALQRTCKVDYLKNEVTNQCFDASTVIAFQKKTTVLGIDYIITKYDTEHGTTTGFLASRFSN